MSGLELRNVDFVIEFGVEKHPELQLDSIPSGFGAAKMKRSFDVGFVQMHSLPLWASQWFDKYDRNEVLENLKQELRHEELDDLLTASNLSHVTIHEECVVSPFQCCYHYCQCSVAENLDMETNHRGLKSKSPPWNCLGDHHRSSRHVMYRAIWRRCRLRDLRERRRYSQPGDHGSFLRLMIRLPQAHDLIRFALHTEGDAAQLEYPWMMKTLPHTCLRLHEDGKDVGCEQQFLAVLACKHQEGP